MRLCKYCRHYFGEILAENSMRLRRGDNELVVDIVTGKETHKEYGLLAYKERYSILPWKCGKKARYFEPRSNV